jgi:hypothetical protein
MCRVSCVYDVASVAVPRVDCGGWWRVSEWTGGGRCGHSLNRGGNGGGGESLVVVTEAAESHSWW